MHPSSPMLWMATPHYCTRSSKQCSDRCNHRATYIHLYITCCPSIHAAHDSRPIHCLQMYRPIGHPSPIQMTDRLLSHKQTATNDHNGRSTCSTTLYINDANLSSGMQRHINLIYLNNGPKFWGCLHHVMRGTCMTVQEK